MSPQTDTATTVSTDAESRSSPDREASPKAPASDATNRPKTPSHGYGEVRALLDELVAAFPACFRPHGTPGQPPLKFGIGDDVLARKPEIDPALLSSALSVYASGPEYWRSVIGGLPRVDLDGNVTQTVITSEEIAEAKKQLAAFEFKQKAREKSHVEVRGLLDELVAAFPACFKPHGTRGQPPLKIGIGDDILARKPEIDPALLHAALRVYVSSPAYQNSVIAGQPRVDLDGNVTQAVITADEIAHAQHKLHVFRLKAKGRGKRPSQEATGPRADRPAAKPRPVQPPQQGERAAEPTPLVVARQRRAPVVPDQQKSGSPPPPVLAPAREAHRVSSEPKPADLQSDAPPLTHRQQALLTRFGIKSPALRASADRFASQRDSGGAPRVSPAGDPTRRKGR